MPDTTVTTTTVTVPVVTAIKPGIKSTEFILTIVANLFTIFLTFKGVVSPTVAAIIVAAVTGVYGIMRSIVKIYDPAYNVPDLPAGV